ncbi:MAG TPA: ATP-binding protein, partial [Frankiaceae bacterium]|nr:ATP-binding protein [Frankiaceae bacterium]
MTTTSPIRLSHSPCVTLGPVRLAGRAALRARLDQLLQDAATGHGTALQLTGEPGIGKTALLGYATSRATGFGVLRVHGVASERELPYAGLHILCLQMLDHLRGLEDAQRQALTAAVGLAAGPAPDRFLVSLATLNLLTRVAERQPLLCVVDDAHWLDQATAQVLAFVARRAGQGSLLLLLARRDQPRLTDFDGVARVHVGPLPNADARGLLVDAAPSRVDAAVLERILTEAQGNPVAIAEALEGVTAGDLAGGYAIPAPPSEPTGFDSEYLERALRLPADAGRLLLAAAADPTGDPTLLWRAAARLGIPPEASGSLESAGLLVFGPLVRFAWPRLRSHYYAAASAQQRRTIHGVLAQATLDDLDADRRAWHQALAASGFDEAVSDRLERSAPAAQARGGVCARAAFLERSTLLTPDAGRRADRAIAAAAAKYQAGAPETAEQLLSIAEMAPPDDVRRASAALQRARIAFSTRPDERVHKCLLDAARQIEAHAPALAREAYLEAIVAAMVAADPGTGLSLSDIARAARAAVPSRSDRPADLLLDGLATRLLDGYVASIPPLTKALAAFEAAEPGAGTARWLCLASCVAVDLWDGRSWRRLTARHARLAADYELAEASCAPAYPALADFYHGRPAAAALMGSVKSPADGGAAPSLMHPTLLLAAWRGRRIEFEELLPKARESAGAQPAGMAGSASSLASAVLHNSAGRYQNAVFAALPPAESGQLGICGWALAELVEAAVRNAQPETAARALERLSHATNATGTDWGLGVQATCRALVAEDQAAETLYLEGIDRLARAGIAAHLGRAQLLYGEWLRRRNRRIDARGP